MIDPNLENMINEHINDAKRTIENIKNGKLLDSEKSELLDIEYKFIEQESENLLRIKKDAAIRKMIDCEGLIFKNFNEQNEHNSDHDDFCVSFGWLIEIYKSNNDKKWSSDISKIRSEIYKEYSKLENK